MTVLMIGATEREKIATIIAYAKLNPVPFSQVSQGVLNNSDVLALKDRKPDTIVPATQHIVFPGGYRAAFSLEQQPPGLCSHLSISVKGRRKGAIPSLDAIEMICEEFGVPFLANNVWTEEFAPGEFAINLVSLFLPEDKP